MIAILISPEVKAITMMAEELETQINLSVCRFFLDIQGLPYSLDPRCESLTSDRFDTVVAAGPEALSYLVTQQWSYPAFYAMVLNPERILNKNQVFCGVSLNIPIVTNQFNVIRQTFPRVSRIGVMFDPVHNQAWFDQAQPIAAINNITLVPLKVNDPKDINIHFEKTGPSVEAILFIPDRKVTQHTVVIEHIIKSAFHFGIPTIGYNQFFYESGAALSYVVNYRAVGKQLSDMIQLYMQGQPCKSTGPVYEVWLNRKVVNKLKLTVGEHLPVVIKEDE